VPLNKFFISHRETCLKKGEVMTKIIIPREEASTRACFEKFGLREAASIAVVSVAVAIVIKDGICANARFVIGAAAPTPKISASASDILIGKNVSEFSEDSSMLKLVCKAAAADSRPINDLRGSANYRQDIIKVLAKRAIAKAISRAST
jgi:carbon-monoxide dehydrogenase medium subunit